MPFYAQGKDISRSSSHRDRVDPESLVNRGAQRLQPASVVPARALGNVGGRGRGGRRSSCVRAMQYVLELTWILFLRFLEEQEAKKVGVAEALAAHKGKLRIADELCKTAAQKVAEAGVQAQDCAKGLKS